MLNFDEILLELSYRVEGGIVDLTKESQLSVLEEVLKENGVTNMNEILQKARVYFSYLNEDKTTIVKNKKTGNLYPVKNVDPNKHVVATPADIKKAKEDDSKVLPGV